VLAVLFAAGDVLAQGVLRKRSAPKDTEAASCEIRSAHALDFGEYMPGQAATLNGTGAVTTRCSQGNVALTLSAGPSFNTGSVMNRALREAGGNDLLRYQLYIDSAHATIWGDGVNGGQPFRRVVPASTQTFTFHGAIGAGQSVSPGDYADRITIVVMP
jgi:spore coat protein U-like protein